MTGVLIKRGQFWTQGHTEGRQHRETCEEDGHLQIREAWSRSSSHQTTEGTRPEDTLISEF